MNNRINTFLNIFFLFFLTTGTALKAQSFDRGVELIREVFYLDSPSGILVPSDREELISVLSSRALTRFRDASAMNAEEQKMVDNLIALLTVSIEKMVGLDGVRAREVELTATDKFRLSSMRALLARLRFAEAFKSDAELRLDKHLPRSDAELIMEQIIASQGSKHPALIFGTMRSVVNFRSTGSAQAYVPAYLFSNTNTNSRAELDKKCSEFDAAEIYYLWQVAFSYLSSAESRDLLLGSSQASNYARELWSEVIDALFIAVAKLNRMAPGYSWLTHDAELLPIIVKSMIEDIRKFNTLVVSPIDTGDQRELYAVLEDDLMKMTDLTQQLSRVLAGPDINKPLILDSVPKLQFVFNRAAGAKMGISVSFFEIFRLSNRLQTSLDVGYLIEYLQNRPVEPFVVSSHLTATHPPYEQLWVNLHSAYRWVRKSSSSEFASNKEFNHESLVTLAKAMNTTALNFAISSYTEKSHNFNPKAVWFFGFENELKQLPPALRLSAVTLFMQVWKVPYDRKIDKGAFSAELLKFERVFTEEISPKNFPYISDKHQFISGIIRYLDYIERLINIDNTSVLLQAIEFKEKIRLQFLTVMGSNPHKWSTESKGPDGSGALCSSGFEE